MAQGESLFNVHTGDDVSSCPNATGEADQLYRPFWWRPPVLLTRLLSPLQFLLNSAFACATLYPPFPTMPAANLRCCVSFPDLASSSVSSITKRGVEYVKGSLSYQVQDHRSPRLFLSLPLPRTRSLLNTSDTCSSSVVCASESRGTRSRLRILSTSHSHRPQTAAVFLHRHSTPWFASCFVFSHFGRTNSNLLFTETSLAAPNNILVWRDAAPRTAGASEKDPTVGGRGCICTRRFMSTVDQSEDEQVRTGPYPAPQPLDGLQWSWWELYVKGQNPEYPPRQRMFEFLTQKGIDVLEMEIREIEDFTKWLEMRRVYGDKFPRFPYDVTLEDKIEALREKYPLESKH